VQLTTWTPRSKKNIANKVTTLRRHLEATHDVSDYQETLACTDHLIRETIVSGSSARTSRPNSSDVKKRKAGKLEAIRTRDPELRERVPSTPVAPYSDETFRRLAVEWPMATDQISHSAIFKRRHCLVNFTTQPLQAFSASPHSKQ
jgi:hypothetical protein